MSEGFVADSSVGVAWAAHSQASEATDQLLEKVAGGGPLVVPTLWVLFRRKRIIADERDRALGALARLPLVVDDEGCRQAFGKVSELAAEHGLSVYDAAYLELALRRKLPLASRDDALCNTAKDCHVRLLL